MGYIKGTLYLVMGNGKAKKPIIGVQIDRSLLRLLDADAQAEGISRSDMLRKIIRDRFRPSIDRDTVPV